MSRASSLAMALGAALALGACAGEGGLPTSEAPEFQAASVGGPACNLTELRKATSALFGSRHQANETAKLFTSKNVNTSAATPHAYTLFSFIEAKREGSNSWLATDPAKGAELTLQIIACSDVVYTDALLSGTAALATARAAFEAALDADGAGTYAVRGGTISPNNASVSSRNHEAGLGAPNSFSSWFGTVQGGRSLIIGYTIPEFFAEEIADVAYDWSMIRPSGSQALSGLATVSYCVDDSFTKEELRVQHLPTGSGGVILPISNTPAAGVVCTQTESLRHAEPSSFVMRMIHSVLGAVRPSPLFATVLKGPVSGTIGGFSPTAVVDPNTLIITYADTVVRDVAVNQLIRDSNGNPIQVTVTGAKGTPWSGVEVTIVGQANNGNTLMLACSTQTTNALGVVTFPNLSVNKPGGLKLVALVNPVLSGDVVPGVDPDVVSYDGSAISGRFNVGPGSGTVPSCS